MLQTLLFKGNVSTLKAELISILEPIFGESIRATIEQYYDDASELIDLADNMLSRYYGRDKSDEMLGRIKRKYGIKQR